MKKLTCHCGAVEAEIKIQDNFGLADQFYEIHILSNYLMIVLISIHILAVMVHKIFFNDNYYHFGFYSHL